MSMDVFEQFTLTPLTEDQLATVMTDLENYEISEDVNDSEFLQYLAGDDLVYLDGKYYWVETVQLGNYMELQPVDEEGVITGVCYYNEGDTSVIREIMGVY